MSAFERLDAQDSAFLYFESPTMHMHIGGLLVFEDAGASVADLRRQIDDRLRYVPRLRKRVIDVPFGQGHPVWVDDTNFDITHHVRHTALPAPAGEHQLVQLMGEVMSRRLDRDRPLWECWLVDMPGNDTKGIVYKAHHAVIDGVAGIDLATLILDSQRESAPRPEEDAWQPEAAPTSRELLSTAWAQRRRIPGKLVNGTRSALGHPAVTRQRVRDLSRGLVHVAKNALFPAPYSPLTASSGSQRRFDVVSMKLDDVVAAKTRHGATVNDIVMAIVAGGLRHLLLTRGDDISGLDLRCAVPVSTRPDDERGELGNKLAMVFSDLPVDEDDPSVRVSRIHDQMSELKDTDIVGITQSLMSMAQDVPPQVFSLVGRALKHQWVMNLTITSIPGPDFPLFCLGGQVLEIAPFAPIFGQTLLSATALSYNGKLTLGLGADWDGVRDLDVLREGIEKSLSELGS